MQADRAEYETAPEPVKPRARKRPLCARFFTAAGSVSAAKRAPAKHRGAFQRLNFGAPIADDISQALWIQAGLSKEFEKPGSA